MTNDPQLIANRGVYLRSLREHLPMELRAFADELNADPMVSDDPNGSDELLTLAELSRAFHLSQDTMSHNALYGRDLGRVLAVASEHYAARSASGLHLPRPEEIQGSAQRDEPTVGAHLRYLSGVADRLLRDARGGEVTVPGNARIRLEVRLRALAPTLQALSTRAAPTDSAEARRVEVLSDLYNRLVGVTEFLQVMSFRARPDLANVSTVGRDTLVLPTPRYMPHHRALRALQELATAAEQLRTENGLGATAIIKRLDAVRGTMTQALGQDPHLDFALQRYFNRIVDTYVAATVPTVAQDREQPFLRASEQTALLAMKFVLTLE
jgi:hypothetical protein